MTVGKDKARIVNLVTGEILVVPSYIVRGLTKAKFNIRWAPINTVNDKDIADYIWDIRDGQACNRRDQA